MKHIEMKFHLKFISFFVLGLLVTAISCSRQELRSEYLRKPFAHPGMLQSKDDLDFLKQNILAENEPWYSAFKRLEAETDLLFKPEACAYVSVGAYGVNSTGGKEFSSGAKYAYACALLWYVTGDRRYADKAIEVLNAWSYKLWGFDGNNAKLNVGLFGQYYLNAAEILRYSGAEWQAEDVEQFERLLRTVFYPTIKDFFTEANGNWDASMINTMMCMGVFLDEHTWFNRAVERFYRGDGNSGITKYIYPGGQCQETTRDWDHVQLGLGELSAVCQVAWTQGLDFYAAADNRLAQGYEHAAKFLTGGDVPVFGDVSYRLRDEVRDIYRSIYQHYAVEKGIELPYTRQMMVKMKDSTSLALLSATRYADRLLEEKPLLPLPIKRKVKPSETGALNKETALFDGAVLLNPGDDIQQAIDQSRGEWIVLRKGIHRLDRPLLLKSGTRLAGEGRESVLILARDCESPTIVNKDEDMSGVVIRNLLIEGAVKPGTGFDPNYERSGRLYGNAPARAGIVFLSDSVGKMKDIRLENLTVQNFTKNGAFISGAADVRVYKCDFDNNGSAVVPGPYLHHNLRIGRVENAEVADSRFTSSLWGNGVDVAFSRHVSIVGNELARNALSGIHLADVSEAVVEGNLIEGNSSSGVVVEQLMDGCFDVRLTGNQIQYNKGTSVEERGKNFTFVRGNTCTANL